MDENFTEQSSRIITLYFESIKHPQLLLNHALSLHQKGCTIAAIKAGTSEAGSRAAASHTGALAGNDEFVDALFRKVGIIRCYSREELINVAAILTHQPIEGNQVAIITHAGGPAVLLTDILSKAGISVPPMPSEVAAELLPQLNAGSSAGNPIDLLATGTAAQLDLAIDSCEKRFDAVGAMVVIFGSAGLFDVTEVYNTLARQQKSCTKPVFAVLPSVVNAQSEMETFINQSNICFTDEVIFGQALAAVINRPKVFIKNTSIYQSIDYKHLNINNFLPPSEVNELLDRYEIPRVKEFIINTIYELEHIAGCLTCPVVAKASGLIHKTEAGGVITNINNHAELNSSFNQLMAIDGCNAVITQSQISGFELYIGTKREPGYPPLIVFGAGGIYLEMFKDVVSVLAPVTTDEILERLKNLQCYPVFGGFRGKKPVSANRFAAIVVAVSEMMLNEPSITELDINPLIANQEAVLSVDARIKTG
jgi:acetyltransferase